jgi:hypothetical protein
METLQTPETTDEQPSQPTAELVQAVGYTSVAPDDYEWIEDVAFGD